MKLRYAILVLACLCIFSGVDGQVINRVEPPFWWVGMQNPKLQIMVYGEDISGTQPSIEAEGVKLTAVHRLASPNYLFIDIEIEPDVQFGSIPVKFMVDGESLISYQYELKPREPASANRQGFNNSDVMYLITPDRFANGDETNDEIAGMREGLNRTEPFGRHGGDIQGILDHLDYIKEMGFTAIWLNPVLENNQDEASYHGYATTDYYKVDPRFGTNDEYVNLSEQAKDMGLKMIMDIIVNHCGSEHWWMEDPPSNDWINYYGQPYQGTNHRKSTLIDPYVSPSDRELMVKGWFVPTMPDLNQRNPFLATYLIQNSIWWIEYAHLAGIRQDTYPYPYRSFMADWTCAIMQEYPNFSIVGEEWVENPAIIAYWQQDKINPDGYTSCLPSLMDFPMTSNLHRALKEEEGWSTGWRRLYENLANDFLYAHPEQMVIFPDNHDMSRIFTQVDEDYDLFKMALVYILTMRGTPQLYYGTEILMSNKGTDSHGIIRSDFPGGWQGDDVNAFSGEGLTEDQKGAKAFVRKLLRWRKNKNVIHSGKLMHYVPEDGIYVYFRYDGTEKVMVVLNKSHDVKDLDLNRFKESISDATTATEIVTGGNYTLASSLKIPARGSLILELE